jgi:hypothetical protein
MMAILDDLAGSQEQVISEFFGLKPISGHSGTRVQRADPESRKETLCVLLDSGFADLLSAPRNDRGE